MSSAMFNSHTFGIGEMITQRKLFSVPPHQRSYSWKYEQVEQFLIDIEEAFSNNAKDYFIGLIVLRGPQDGVWEVLDGQQRLTTVTMIYSAIRNWLKDRGFDGDAKQIENEYLGVRQLGGEFSTRMHLNSINHESFAQHVVATSPMAELQKAASMLPKKTSNFLLFDAAITCREWVESFATKAAATEEGNAKALFRLSRFLETNVKVVSVDVATDADAYVLFESLNNRGADLSALDLVKNYIFSIAEPTDFSSLERQWEQLTSLIKGSDADDFLKYFWTSHFGIIQKNDLFKRIRDEFQGKGASKQLLKELLDAASFAEALDDPKHELWLPYSMETQDILAAIKAIGSKQARPPLYTAFKTFPEAVLDAFLQDLTVSLFRFQMIGHGRTGVLEKVLGRTCRMIWSQEIGEQSEWRSVLKELMISDEQFLSDFVEHREQKVSRAQYVLTQLEKARGTPLSDLNEARCIHLPPLADNPEENYKKLGSYFLLEHELGTEYALAIRQKVPLEISEISEGIFRQSSFESTNNAVELTQWGSKSIDSRTAALAQEACRIWGID